MNATDLLMKLGFMEVTEILVNHFINLQISVSVLCLTKRLKVERVL